MIKEKCKNLVINSWYLDDGILVGSRRDILEAFNILDEHGKQFGLFLNPKKCVLYAENVQKEYWDTFPAEIHRAYDGIRLLGSPIGTASYIQNFAAEKVDEILKLMNKIKDLENPQLELILFRSGATFPKINFLLRTVDFETIKDQIQKFDWNINDSLEHVVGEKLDSFSRDLWSLPLSMAGFGIPFASEVAPAALASSIGNTWELQKLQNVTKPRESFPCTVDFLQSKLPNLILNIQNLTKMKQKDLKFKLSQIKLEYLLKK